MKKGFTLIEVMISIIIFSLLVIFMSNVISSLHISLNTLNKVYQKNKNTSYIVETLYLDLLEAKSIKIINKNKNYSILYIQTSNSLYNIPMPYIIWYVSKNNNSLMRLETPNQITLPIGNIENYYIDKFNKNITIFKIYQKQNNFFIFIKNKDTLYFEVKK